MNLLQSTKRRLPEKTGTGAVPVARSGPLRGGGKISGPRGGRASLDQEEHGGDPDGGGQAEHEGNPQPQLG